VIFVYHPAKPFSWPACLSQAGVEFDGRPGKGRVLEHGMLWLSDDSVKFTPEGAQANVTNTRLTNIREVRVAHSNTEQGDTKLCRVMVSGFVLKSPKVLVQVDCVFE